MRMRIAAMAALGALVIGMALPAEAYAQNCRALRWACENKGELGLEGAGTCRRYREECGERRHNRCDELRYACEHKDELGLEGAGTCRRYRETCG